jgi:hypothetical protein
MAALQFSCIIATMKVAVTVSLQENKLPFETAPLINFI